MIKVVLHGGRSGEKSESNDRFFAEFASDVNKPVVRVAMCYWARLKNEWEAKYESDLRLIRNQTEKMIEGIVVENPEDLKAKLADCEVLYVAGGEVAPIQRYVPELKWLAKALEGKTYIGSSMGAFVASIAYVSSSDGEADDQNRVLPGFGMVPVTTLCHFDVEQQKNQKIRLLKEVHPNLPVLTLDEGEWVRMWI